MGLRILVVGLGSIGTRHARLVKRHFSHDVVALRSGAGDEGNGLGIPEMHSWDEVDEGAFDVALIANPTNLHIETASRCVERGLHVFLEKPIDCSVDGLDELLKMVREHRVSSYVAYPLRFHPVVRALKEHLTEGRVLHAGMVCASYLPDWRPGRDFTKVHSRFRDRGGGVFLEMSHELDTAEYLFGRIRGIKGTLDRVSDLTADADDCADLIVSHGSATTNIHLDLFSRVARRYVEIETTEGYLRGDLRDPGIAGVMGGRAIGQQFEVEADDMYLAQLRYFFDNVGRSNMMNSLAEASSLFRTMIGFREGQGYGTSGDHLRPRRVAGG
jgi:predicted dehydrogenase